MIAGACLLVSFVVVERRIGHRDAGQPLVDLGLFRSPSFTWGATLATVVFFAFLGLSFTIPQYFQGVRGTDAMGTGLRMLPFIGGLMVGGAAADRIVRLGGAKARVAVGFTLMAAGLFAGTATTADTSLGFVLAWMTVVGAGLGLALPTPMDAALGQLSKERAGVGSGLITALRQVGGTVGVAVWALC